MAVVLESKSALRVWDGVVAGGNRCARVGWNAPVNRRHVPDQRIHVTPNMPAASQGVTAPNQSVSFAFQDARDYRRTLERDTKAAVKFLESAVTPKFAPVVRIAFFGWIADSRDRGARTPSTRGRRNRNLGFAKGRFIRGRSCESKTALYVSTPEMAFAKWQACSP